MREPMSADALAAEKARADEAVALLREWQREAEHSETCGSRWAPNPCDCGLDDLLDRSAAFLARTEEARP